MQSSKTQYTKWMIDSGLSIHITNNKNDFDEYYPYEEFKKVYTANKHAPTYSLGEGYVFLKSQTNLHSWQDVLYQMQLIGYCLQDS